MNERALVAEMQTQLIAQTWTGSSTVVFPTGSVLVVADLREGFINALDTGVRTPFALVAPLSAESDPEFNEEPDWIRFQFGVLMGVVIPGDHVGQNALMGGNRASSTTSEGAGLLHLEPEVYNAVGKLNALESVVLQILQRSEEGGATDPKGRYIAYRIIVFEAWGSAT